MIFLSKRIWNHTEVDSRNARKTIFLRIFFGNRTITRIATRRRYALLSLVSAPMSTNQN